MEHSKVLTFREEIENEMKVLRFEIVNVGSSTTESQRNNLVKRINDLYRRLQAEKRNHNHRIAKNEKRLGRRVTSEARTRYEERGRLYQLLLKTTTTYITQVRYLSISAKNQFEQYEVEK